MITVFTAVFPEGTEGELTQSPLSVVDTETFLRVTGKITVLLIK
jgi:hypothetical protein